MERKRLSQDPARARGSGWEGSHVAKLRTRRWSAVTGGQADDRNRPKSDRSGRGSTAGRCRPMPGCVHRYRPVLHAVAGALLTAISSVERASAGRAPLLAKAGLRDCATRRSLDLGL